VYLDGALELPHGPPFQVVDSYPAGDIGDSLSARLREQQRRTSDQRFDNEGAFKDQASAGVGSMEGSEV